MMRILRSQGLVGAALLLLISARVNSFLCTPPHYKKPIQDSSLAAKMGDGGPQGYGMGMGGYEGGRGGAMGSGGQGGGMPTPRELDDSSAVNIVTLVGRLGSEPTVKYLDSGNCVLSVSLAVRRDYTSKSETEPDCDWIRVEAWGRTAETIASMAQKGSRLVVMGRLAVSSWTDKYGQSRSDVKVKIRKAEILDPVSRGNGGGWDGQGGEQAAAMMDHSGGMVMGGDGYQSGAPSRASSYGSSGSRKASSAYEGMPGSMMGRGGGGGGMSPPYNAGGQGKRAAGAGMYSQVGGGGGMPQQGRGPQAMEMQGGGEDLYDTNIDMELPF